MITVNMLENQFNSLRDISKKFPGLWIKWQCKLESKEIKQVTKLWNNWLYDK